MKAVASKIHREGQGVLKAISASQSPEAALPREYQTIFKNNGKPMVIVDDDLTIFLANTEFEKLSGYTKKEIEGTKKWTEFVARQDRRRMKEYHLLRKSDPMLAPRCCEFRFVDRHGKIRNIVLTIGQIPGTTKNMASLQDVTDRRQAEVTQRAGEERYQTFFENSRDAVYITTRDGTYVDANRAALDLFGYTREEMKKMKARQLYADPADARRLRKEIEEKGFVQDFEVRLRKKDGTEMDCMFTVTALRGDDGSILEYQGIARDVTAHKRAEQALRESEEKYRAIFDSMLEGYFEVDLVGNLTFFNEAVSKFFGHSGDELMGLNYQAFTSPEGTQRLFQIFSEVFKTGNPHEIDNYEIVKKDGSIGIAEFSVSLLRNAAGETIGFRGVTRDVTEKRKIQKAFGEKEEKYRTILESIEDGYYELDLTGNFTFVNNATCGRLGYTKEELIGMNNRAYTSPETAKKIYEIFNAIYKGGKSTNVFDYEAIRKDGSTITLELSASLMRDKKGEPVGFRGISRDITERKQMEESLHQSEERYRTILENMQEAYYELDLAGHMTFVNDTACRHLGYTKEELIGTGYRQIQDETTAKKMGEVYKEVYRTGKSLKAVETEYIRKDGTKGDYEISASLIRDAQGKPIGFRGISRDVTERKRAEETLRKSEEKYRTVLETMHDGVFEIDLAGRFTFINDAMCRIAESTRERLISMSNLQYTDETTAKKLYEVFSGIYKTGAPVSGFAFEFTKRDGTKGFQEVSASLIRDAQGKPIGFRGISRDVTERKKMEEELRKSEEKYRTILETMQEGYFEVDLTGNFTFVNDASCRHIGYTKEEMIGTNSKHFQDETTAEKMFQLCLDIYRTGEPITATEAVWIKRDGTKGTYEASMSLIRDSKGNPIGFRGVSRNITERKKTEEALQQSEEKYRTILEAMQEAYYELDLAGHMTFVNDTVCRHLGYTKEELIRTGYRQIQDETTAKKMSEIYKEVYRTGKSLKAVETEYIRKDGTKGMYELSASLISDAQGKPIGFRGVSRDIGERKQAQEALRKSEEKYRTILASIEDGYGELDLGGKLIFFNDALPRILGYPADELKNLHFNNRHYMDEENAERVRQAYTEVYATGKPNQGFQYEIMAQDGTRRYLECSVSLRKDADGQPVGFQGVVRDITERKRIEEALRLSEEKYRTILETMQESYYELGLAGHFTFLNDALCRHLGYSKEELMGTDPQQLQDETTAKKINQIYREIYRTGESVKALETEYIRKDGTKGMYELSASLIRDAQGKPIGFRGVSRDITERKLAEEALRRSEERYRTIIENIQDGYFENDLAGNFTFVNDSLCKNIGYTSDELIGMNYQQYTKKETQKKVLQAYNKLYTTGEPVKGLEYEVITKDGAKSFTEISVSLIRDSKNKPIGFRGISRDVTERKQAEEKLRQSEERYRGILENMQEAYYETDPAGHLAFVNDAICQHLGYSKEELIGKKSGSFQDEINAQKIAQAFTEIYRTGEPVKAVEAEYIRKDGTRGSYELSASLIRDAQGKPAGFRGVSRDITERKQAEERLRQSEERYRTILESIEDGYYEVDLSGNFIFFNDVTCAHLGYPREQLIGMNNRQYTDEKTAKKLYHLYVEVYNTGKPLRGFVYERIRKDGTKWFSEVSVSLIRDAQGKPIGFRGISRDVTERRNAEEQLKRYATELERSNEEVKNFAYIVSHDLRVPLVNLKGYTSELRTALGVIGANFEAALPHLIDEKRSAVAVALHEDVPEALEFISNSVSRMDSFINAILMLSRLGRQDLKPEPLDMNALVQAALESMSHQIKERGIEVHVGSMPQVVADRIAMERTIGNILSNAVKYVDPERPCRIEVAAEVNNGETIFTIQDTGRGIAQEDMHKVFAPFRRAGKQDIQGEGMGLAYVQTLVRRHGGRIWCDSSLDKGTTFTFTIATTFKQGASDA